MLKGTHSVLTVSNSRHFLVSWSLSYFKSLISLCNGNTHNTHRSDRQQKHPDPQYYLQYTKHSCGKREAVSSQQVHKWRRRQEVTSYYCGSSQRKQVVITDPSQHNMQCTLTDYSPLTPPSLSQSFGIIFISGYFNVKIECHCTCWKITTSRKTIFAKKNKQTYQNRVRVIYTG
jgi:hypothetical protein